MMGRRQKHNARTVIVDGLKFHSRLEAECYLRVKASGLVFGLQPQWEIIPSQVGPSGLRYRAANYTADFILHRGTSEWVVEVKGKSTAAEADYVLRKKLMLHVHNIEVVEIRDISSMEKLIAGILTC